MLRRLLPILLLTNAACGRTPPPPPAVVAPPATPVAPPAAPAVPPPAAPSPTVALVLPPADVGDIAPNFSLLDTDGRVVELGTFKGKPVVLEWFNPGCPFVKYAHEEGPLKNLAHKYAEKGVVWLAVNSSAPGREGAGKDRNVAARAAWELDHPVLLDETGLVGKHYGATRTPEVFVLDKDRKIVYHGAPDNLPGGNLAEGEGEEPYLVNALDAVLAGKPVAKSKTQPRGCSVKYADEAPH